MKQETNELLKQIRNILVIIAVILVVNVIVTGMNSGNRNLSTSGSGNTDGTSESTGSGTTTEYDVSAFTEVTVDEMFTKVNTSGYQVVYVGRSGCGYCGMFLPALREAQTNFKYTTLYVDLDKVTSDGATKMQGISDELKEKFGYTPMVIVYKDGAYQDVWIGYDEYSAFEKFLTEKGMTK